MKTKKKPSKKAPKSSASKKSAGPSAVLSKSEAAFSLSVKTEGLEPIFASAYLMMDKAFVSLSGDREKTVVVTLRAKNPKAFSSAALAAEFVLDLASQKIRWAVSKNNLPIREFIAEQAVLIANGTVAPPSAASAPPEPTSEQLTDDQRAEIEKLISEVESEIKAMNQDKTKSVNADPKGVKASWEEKQEQGNKV
jgi:His-Xaa-Ser system protein HxsD